ncbi:unnamed protein product [Natator depressus]
MHQTRPPRTLNLTLIWVRDKWKTDFKTRYGHFNCLVMPLGLTNGPMTLQHFISDVCGDILDQYIVIYLDDILLFLENSEQHVPHNGPQRGCGSMVSIQNWKSEPSANSPQSFWGMSSPQKELRLIQIRWKSFPTGRKLEVLKKSSAS